jgi:hypothetical protein
MPIGLALLFFTVWLAGMTIGPTVRLLAAITRPSTEGLLSLLFVGAAWAGGYVVLEAAKAAREAWVRPSLALDLDGLRLTWGDGTPGPLRGPWSAAILAMPLLAGLLVLAPAVVRSGNLSAWLVGLVLAVPWTAGARAWSRHVAAEWRALGRHELEIGAGRLRLVHRHPLERTRDESFALAGLRARALAGRGLVIDTPEGERRLGCRLQADELEEVAGWITRAGGAAGADPAPVPDALRRLRERLAATASGQAPGVSVERRGVP